VDILQDSIVLGIICGLFFGKQIGVFGFTCLLRWGFKLKLPEKSSLLAFYGVSILCGIGFTMSLFLGTLSFEYTDPVYLAKVRIGVILGSVLSGIAGAIVLYFTLPFKKARSE
jgi:NhaA family Na+:H+ antiporter